MKSKGGRGAYGLVTQSIGGGGGLGGSVSGSFAGSNGGAGTTCGTVHVTDNRVASATGSNSIGIFAQTTAGASSGAFRLNANQTAVANGLQDIWNAGGGTFDSSFANDTALVGETAGMWSRVGGRMTSQSASGGSRDTPARR